MRQSFSEFRDHDDGLQLVGEDRVDEYAAPDRRLPAIVLTVLVMALFAGGLWFAYVQGTHHPATLASGDSAKLIRADDRPTKVKPDQPGGMAIPDQNVSLYNDRPGAPPIEKLLPAAEQPLPRPAPPPKEAVAPPPAPAAPTAAAPAAPSAAHPAAKAPPPVAKTAAPAKTPAAAPPPGAKTGPVQVQLASLRSSDAAREEWARLKRENSDLLGKMTAVAVRTDLGDKGIYYRVLAGSFGDAAAAEKLCDALKRRNFGCSLAR